MLRSDPWIAEGVLAEPDVRPWLVWVDPRGITVL